MIKEKQLLRQRIKKKDKKNTPQVRSNKFHA